jgi:type IV pilus assembly protein PilM
MSLFKVKSVVGIDLDAYEVRAAEISGTAEKPSLLGLGRVALPEGVVKDGKVNQPEILHEIIAKLWQESKFKSRNVILGVSNQDVIIRFALVPKIPADKLDNLIRFQAQDFLPISINDVELDYIVLNEVQGEKQTMLKVLLVAGRRSMLNNFTRTINEAGLRLQDIDVSILALARLVQGGENTFAIVNYSKEQISLIILSHGVPAFARILSVYPAGQVQEDTYQNQAEREIAVTAESAVTGDNSGILNDGIVGEIRSSILYYQSQNPESVVEKCIVASTANGRSNVQSILRDKLGINVEMLDPLKGLNTYHLSGNNSFGNASDFSVGISLALRGLEGNRT